MKRPWIASAIASMLMPAVALSAAGQPDAQPALIPAPAKLVLRHGSLTLRDGAVLSVEGDDEARQIALRFAGQVQQIGGPRLHVLAAQDAGAEDSAVLRFSLDANAPVAAAEGYSLEIDRSGARLRARDPRGLVHGSATLWQLIAGAGTANSRVIVPALDDRRRAALRLARADARLRAPLPVARVHRALHRLDGAAQAERAALAPDRRPGLASRDPQVPAAHRDRRLARAGRARRRGGHRPGHRSGRALYGGYYSQETVRAHRAPTRPSAVSRSCPRSRCRVTRPRRSSAYPRSASTEAVHATVPADWGDLPKPVQRRGHDLHVPRGRAARGDGALSRASYIHVGGDEAVKDQWQSSPQVQRAHARARHRGRARAAELLHAAHRALPRRERAAADRLGRDPRRRPRAAMPP